MSNFVPGNSYWAITVDTFNEIYEVFPEIANYVTQMGNYYFWTGSYDELFNLDDGEWLEYFDQVEYYLSTQGHGGYGP